jgi:hypothetical protein
MCFVGKTRGVLWLQAHQEEEIGIVEEDLEMFYTKWAK